ncbi:hypothetical protein EXIGLDRAFT_771357 [Exidia glandulosa HHB12029]|uniref:Uncharacterized protein n=1 Tax=Exidia glandulosa HHB12029 TaxID=1314781 RepID=A0A165G190_EXIGL|nr:hypothetical protein EXIGLDRAFT_771357 [Exidia glandulosa HHB12029]
MHIEDDNVYMKLPLAILAQRSNMVKKWHDAMVKDPSLGSSVLQALPLKGGNANAYEQLLMLVLPLSLREHRPLATRNFQELRAMEGVTAYLEMPDEVAAIERAIQDLLKAGEPEPPAERIEHEHYCSKLTYDGLYFLIFCSNVLLRLPASVIAFRCPTIAAMLGEALGECTQGRTKEDPIILHYGTITDWYPLLRWILPLDNFAGLDTLTTTELLSVLDLCDFLTMSEDLKVVASILHKRRDDKLSTGP